MNMFTSSNQLLSQLTGIFFYYELINKLKLNKPIFKFLIAYGVFKNKIIYRSRVHQEKFFRGRGV